MDITLDYKKDCIVYGKNTMEILYMYNENFKEYGLEHTRILYKIRPYFLIEGYSYADHLSRMIYQNDYYFHKAPGLIVAYNYIDALEEISRHTKKDDKWNLYVEDFYDNIFIKCALMVAKSKDIKVNIKKNIHIQRSVSIAYSNTFIIRNLMKGRIFLRYIFGSLRKALMQTSMDKSDVVIMSNSILFDRDPEKNLVFGGIISELNASGIKNKIIYYDQAQQVEKMMKFLKEELFFKHAYAGDHYSVKHFLDCGKDLREIRKRWKSLRDQSSFRKIFRYKNYDIFDIMTPRLDLVFNAVGYMFCDIRHITKKIIDKSGFKIVLTDHEENMYAKGFEMNLKNSRQKVYVLSHELISENSVHLHFKNKHVLNRDSPDWRPLPDMKFIWGEYSKDKLINTCNYPEDILKITGNPKFDQLYVPYNIRKRHKGDRIRILVADQNDYKKLLEYKRLAKALPEYDFTIKPHPAEITEYWDKIFLDKTDNLHIVNKYSNTYDLMRTSDYVLIRNSTSGFEAMILGKIVFIYNPDHGKILHGLPYETSGKVKSLYSPKELQEEISRIEKSSTYRRTVMNKIESFVQEIHPKAGNASKNIVSYIKKELRNPSKKP